MDVRFTELTNVMKGKAMSQIANIIENKINSMDATIVA